MSPLAWTRNGRSRKGRRHRISSSDDWRARAAAVARLTEDADAAFVHALVESLRHSHRDFNLLSSALKLLGSTNVEVSGVLAELLCDQDPDLRIQAALALGAQQDPSAIPALRAALADPEINVRFQAIESLGRLRAARRAGRSRRHRRSR